MLEPEEVLDLKVLVHMDDTVKAANDIILYIKVSVIPSTIPTL